MCWSNAEYSRAGLSVHQVPWALAAYAVMSMVAFGMYWADKRSALQDRRRIPENRLHLAELLGGWPGALVAQQVLHHKTRKASFRAVFWIIVLVHQVLWADWVLADGQYFTRWVHSML